jgi:predicted amidohydrolase YtcJ
VIIDGKGKTLIPGMIDAHGHLSSLGYTLLQIDLRNTTSATQAALAIADYAENKPYLEWIRGRGWNQVLWPGKKFPDAKILDELVPNRPIWLERIDGHAGWANSKALELAGIHADTISPPGGEILRDANGKPTGILIDNAMNLVSQVIPPPTQEELSAAVDAATEHLLGLGITSTHDAGISAMEHRFYSNLAVKNELKVRLYAMISSTDPELAPILATGPMRDDRDFYSARSVKVYTDGALGSRGAALLAPYSDRPDHSGLLLTSKSQLSQLFEEVISAGFQLAIHAIGDKGNRIALDEIEQAYNKVGGRDLRHRIEHAQVVALKDIPRFKTLNVIPSMQPTHATSDMNMAEDRIGAERLKGAYAWRRFIDQGSILVSGSDYPIELANPFHGIHAAVTRQDHDNQPPLGWIPEQAISRVEALRSFTINAAWAGHQETILGGLSEGKWADFIIIDRDIMKVPADQLWQVEVEQTWVAGKLAYSRD